MVLRDRIELSTSPLPMECSTTELPQQLRRKAHGLRATKRLVPQAPAACKGKGQEEASSE